MKIRDLILSVLALGVIGVTASLVAAASYQMAEIEAVTSTASGDALISDANENLRSIAVGVRDSLDNQMKNQHQLVQSWAMSPTLVEPAKRAAALPKEELFETWSAAKGRRFKDGEAQPDGDASNDVDPRASGYLTRSAQSAAFPELFATDARGYVFAASGPTGDFDQGPDDWRFFEGKGFVKHKPAPGGEPWYKSTQESPDGLWVGNVTWDESANSWGIEIVARLIDADGTPVGTLKTVFDYGRFIKQFVNTRELGLFEIKVVDQNGLIVATSLDAARKVNNPKVKVTDAKYFALAKQNSASGMSPAAERDENGETVYAGFAVSRQNNRHIIVVTQRASHIDGTVSAFVGELATRIRTASTTARRVMLGAGAGVGLLALLVAFALVTLRITRPLNTLTQVSERLARGEIDGLRIELDSKDEIGQFGQSFKGVLAAFQLLLEEAEKGSR
jgi:HAMP domain-containing protein